MKEKSFFDLATDLTSLLPDTEKEPETESRDELNAGKSVQVIKTENKHAMRRVLSELAYWYKDFFDGINSFERNFDDVKSWTPEQ